MSLVRRIDCTQQFPPSTMLRLIVILTSCAAIMSSGCSHEIPPSDSPSGRFTLQESVKDGLVNFKITDHRTNTVYSATTNASKRMRCGFEWDGHDRLWFYSSDIGVYVYQREENGSWIGREHDEVKNKREFVPPSKIAAYLRRIEAMH